MTKGKVVEGRRRRLVAELLSSLPLPPSARRLAVVAVVAANADAAVAVPRWRELARTEQELLNIR